jgi:spore germination protein KC
MIYGTYQSSHISVPDPRKPDNFILLNVKQSRKPSHHVEMVNNTPVNSVKARLEADILSIQSGINYEDNENIHTLEKTTEDFLEKGILQFLEKTRPIHADLCGFGREVKMKYLLWEEWEKVHWLKKYAQSKFDVEVELKIRRPGLMVKTAPAKSSEGDVMD